MAVNVVTCPACGLTAEKVISTVGACRNVSLRIAGPDLLRLCKQEGKYQPSFRCPVLQSALDSPGAIGEPSVWVA